MQGLHAHFSGPAYHIETNTAVDWEWNDQSPRLSQPVLSQVMGADTCQIHSVVCPPQKFSFIGFLLPRNEPVL